MGAPGVSRAQSAVTVHSVGPYMLNRATRSPQRSTRLLGHASPPKPMALREPRSAAGSRFASRAVGKIIWLAPQAIAAPITPSPGSPKCRAAPQYSGSKLVMLPASNERDMQLNMAPF